MKNKKLLNSFAGTFLSVSLVATSLAGVSHSAHAATTDVSSKKFNMSYLFFGDYASEVKATNGSLNAVSPDYFEIDSTGNLIVTSKYSKSFVDLMHQEGLKVTPYLSNNWDASIGRAALANRQALAQELADKIQQLNLDGVDIDIEGLNQNDRANYTDFIKLLNSKIPDKDLSIAVDANPSGATTGWPGSYDYKALSENSDYLMLMAYDDHYDGEKDAGPVAPLPWVEASVQYALGQGVSPDKLVLGMPFYGRLWKTDGPTSNGTDVYGKAVSDRNINDFVQEYHGSVTYDPTQHSEKATFTITSTDPATVVGGITLTPGTYELWYDDQQTITEKIGLVNKYDLKGTGSWALGHEDPSTWDYFRTVLDGGSSSSTGTGSAQTLSDQPNQMTYTVLSGDTLTKIANIYHVSVQSIEEVNGLTSDLIKVGQILVIPTTLAPTPTQSTTPVPSTPAPTPSTSSSSSTLSTPTKTAPSVTKAPAPAAKPVTKPNPVTKTITVSKVITYKVVRGDCLSNIAKKYHTTVTQIKKDNGLRSNVIKSGQELKIKTIATQKAAAMSSSKVTPKITTKAVDKVISYKVVRGDYLSKIAKKYHTSVTQIKKDNGLRSTLLHIGQLLKIKTTITQNVTVKTASVKTTKVTVKPAAKVVKYKVVRGDCLSKIAKKYHTSAAQIKEDNGLHSNLIRIGQVLTIK